MTAREDIRATADRLASLYHQHRDLAAGQLKNSVDFIATDGPFPFVPLHRVILGLRGKDMLARNRSGQELARHHPVLAAMGYVALREGAAGFDAAWDAYHISLLGLGVSSPSKGTPSSRSVRVFYVPVNTDPRQDAVLQAMDKVARDGIPEGFRAAKIWFVQHPGTGEFLPAKAVWGLATGTRGFNAHYARDRLRSLGFKVPGPEQPVAEIAESPESLAALPRTFEGAERQVTRNIRERDLTARRAAEAYWRALRGGLICEGCDIDFGQTYGPRGEGFMHFHHLIPMALASGPRQVDGPRDLVPLCPNCHAIVHRGEVLLEIGDLRALLGKTPRED